MQKNDEIDLYSKTKKSVQKGIKNEACFMPFPIARHVKVVNIENVRNCHFFLEQDGNLNLSVE